MKQNKKLKINSTWIGKDYPPFVIAELSANHNGSIERALKSVEAAKSAGASAIKLQTYSADTMTIDSNGEDFQIHGGLWDGWNLYKLYEWAQTPYEWHEEIFNYAKKLNITCFSTPFDETAVDLLENLNTPAYKIASFEMIDLPLVEYVASTGKPMIISTGMASLEEIEESITTARDAGCKDIVLLHCISGYPAPVEQSNILTISDFEKRFDVIAGLSDHTLGTAVSVASVALGASVIEKHFTIDSNDKGPDSEFSLNPQQLQTLCKDTHDAWASIGTINYNLKCAEENNIKFRRSIYIVEDMKAGDILSVNNMRRIRPGHGLKPKYYEELLGKAVNKDIRKGMALSWDMISK